MTRVEQILAAMGYNVKPQEAQQAKKEEKIENILANNRISREELAIRKRNAENPQEVGEGCSLKLTIGDKKLDLMGNYVFIPSADLIDGIRALFGQDSVKVGYSV